MITVIFFYNADGIEIYELIFIGTAGNPRPFKKNIGSDVGVDYHHNNKSWITSDLFFLCLHCFNSCISNTRGRKPIFIIDSCSTYGNSTTITELSNVTVAFLAPNDSKN